MKEPKEKAGCSVKRFDQSAPEPCLSGWKAASRHPWSALFRSTQRPAVIKMMISDYWAVLDLCVKMSLLIDQVSVNDNHQQGSGVTLRGHQSIRGRRLLTPAARHSNQTNVWR